MPYSVYAQVLDAYGNDCPSGVLGTDGTCNQGDPNYQESTGNLIDTAPGAGATGTYADHGAHWHPQTGYNGNGTVLWRQIVGINTALREQGIRVDGVKYRWVFYNYLNADSSSSTTATIKVTNDDGAVVYQNEYVYDKTNIGVNSVDELTYRASNIDGTTIAGADLAFHFRDYDGGYYRGHQYFYQQDLSLEFIYTADPCAINPLYDTSCSGYAEAYAQQQYDLSCSANALYDVGCPGYDAAFLTQQCNADPLYSQSCPGYADAYLTLQCSIDALYDVTCNGYADAYAQQQYDLACQANPLYDSGCPNYNTVNISPNITDYDTDVVTAFQDDFLKTFVVAEALRLSGANLMLFGFDYGFEYKLANDYKVCTSTTLGICTNWKTMNSFFGGNFSVVDKNGNIIATSEDYEDIGTSSEWTDFTNRLLIDNGITMADVAFVQFDYELYDKADVRNLKANALFVGDPCADNALYSSTCSGYEEAYLAEQCSIQGPLYSPSCVGYAEAYHDQQCSIDTLYANTCPGYATAYYNQQCTIDALYDTGCPGYDEAYFSQQCSIDALYDTSCPGYDDAYYNLQCSNNPLYDSGCNGYADAYFDQQCSIDTLYDSQCPGYAEAFYDQQCSLDALYDAGCPGYETAYYNQQCSIDALYDTGCPGYADAYYIQQCSLDPLYDTGCIGYETAYFSQQCGLDALYDTQCPGYAEAYFDQQCSLDSLYSPQCPGYEEAYFLTYVKPELDRQAEEASGTADEETTVTSPTTTETVFVDPVKEATEVSTTGDAVVDSILRETSNDTTTSVIPDTTNNMPEAPVEAQAPAQEVKEEVKEKEPEVVAELERAIEEPKSEKKEETKEEVASKDTEEKKEDSKSEKKTTKEEKAEARKKKIKEIAEQKAKDLAKNMGEAASLQAQQAVQQQVLSLINFNPDFAKYGSTGIPGGQLPYTDALPDAEVPKNPRGLRNGLAQQILHEKMVDMQYNRE